MRNPPYSCAKSLNVQQKERKGEWTHRRRKEKKRGMRSEKGDNNESRRKEKHVRKERGEKHVWKEREGKYSM